jgi:hypothetical protein
MRRLDMLGQGGGRMDSPNGPKDAPFKANQKKSAKFFFVFKKSLESKIKIACKLKSESFT